MGSLAMLQVPGVIHSSRKYYCGVEDVMEYLDCKESKAYKMIKALRKELVDAGKLTPEYPPGKVPKKYFLQRCMIEE